MWSYSYHIDQLLEHQCTICDVLHVHAHTMLCVHHAFQAKQPGDRYGRSLQRTTSRGGLRAESYSDITLT